VYYRQKSELLYICYKWSIVYSLVSFRIAPVLVVIYITSVYNYTKEQLYILLPTSLGTVPPPQSARTVLGLSVHTAYSLGKVPV
jgi:hypothetical protein